MEMRLSAQADQEEKPSVVFVCIVQDVRSRELRTTHQTPEANVKNEKTDDTIGHTGHGMPETPTPCTVQHTILPPLLQIVSSPTPWPISFGPDTATIQNRGKAFE